MRIPRLLLAGLVVGLVITTFGATTAHATGQPPVDRPDISGYSVDEVSAVQNLHCEDGICSIQIDVGPSAPAWLPAAGLALTVVEDRLKTLPDGAGFTVDDEVAITMPVGDLRLADADISVTVDGNGNVASFHGTASVPRPSLGFLRSGSESKPIRVSVGFDYPDELAFDCVELDPERKYLLLDLESGTELAASLNADPGNSIWLSVPKGQSASVVIDPYERFIFIDGNVSIRYSGNLAFLTQLIDPAETVDLWNGELPVRHSASLHISGTVSDELQDTQLEVSGRYAVDGGKIAEWVKLDGDVLAIEGGVAISDKGMLGTGVVRSTLLNERFLDGAVQAQVFVPFSSEYRDAYVALDTRLDIPFADISAGGHARLDGSLDLAAGGGLELPRKLENGSLAGALKDAWGRTADVASRGYSIAKEPIRSGYDWALDSTDLGYESAAAGLEWSVDLASRQWCSTTGFCPAGTSDLEASHSNEEPTAAAMR